MDDGGKLEIVTTCWPVDNCFKEDTGEPIIVEWKAEKRPWELLLIWAT